MSIPGGPLDLPSTKELLAARIESGEITQDDIDILKRGYRWMIVSSTLGASAGIPLWFAMRKRTPPLSLGRKIILTWFVASTGSFLGFTVGGAAAALEVNKNMVDSERKMQVFEEIMEESREAAANKRAGRIPPPSRLPDGSVRSGASIYDPAPPTDRMDGESKGVEMSGFGQEQQRGVWDAEMTDDGQGSGKPGAVRDIRQATASTWDRIRAGKSLKSDGSDSSSSLNEPGFGQPTNLTAKDLDIKIDSLGSRAGDLGRTGKPLGLGGAVEERDQERERERREFEILVEQERNAGSVAGKEDGFEVGRWR